MFGTRSRKIWADIRARKGRTLLVAASIFLGVLGVVALQGMSDLLVRQLREDIQEDELAMQQVSLAAKPGQPSMDDAALLSLVTGQPGVSAAQGVLQSAFYFRTEDGERFEEGTLQAVTDPMEGLQMEPWRLVEGEYPQAGERQLAVEQRMAERYGLAVGDTLTVRSLNQATVSEETWVISAILFQPYQGFDTQPNQLVFTTLPDARAILGVDGLTALKIQYTDFEEAEALNSQLVATLSQETAYIPVFNQLLDPEANAQIESARTASGILGFLGFTALIVSGFLVFNVINVIVTEQRRQIGVMKSLGSGRGDMFYIYSGIAFGYGLIGVIPGVLVGIPVSYFAAEAIAPMLNSRIDGFQVSATAVTTGMLVGLAVPILASLLPVYNGTKVTILEAMTDLGITSRFGGSRLDRWLGRAPLPIEVRQGVSNVLQKPQRLALTAVTLSIAAGAFMGIFAAFDNLTRIIGALSDGYNASILIFPNDPQDYEALQTLIQDMDGITDVQPGDFLQVEIADYNPTPGGLPDAGTASAILVQGFDTEAENPAFQLELQAGQVWDDTTQDGVVISSGLSITLDKGVGDEIVLVGAGQRQGYTIIGVAEYPFEQIWMRWQTLAAFSGSLVEGQPIPRGLMVILDDNDLTGVETDAYIQEINDTLLQNGITATYQNYPEFVEETTQAISGFQVISSAAALLIALVGALGLLSTLYMSVFERQKEIGIMRSIGAGSARIASQFITEGLVVGLVAWGVGLPISYMVVTGFEGMLQLGEAFVFTYPSQAAVLGGVGILVITGVASLLPSLSAARKTVSDILRYQ